MRFLLSLGVFVFSAFLILSCDTNPLPDTSVTVSDAPDGRLYTLSQTDSLITIFDTKTLSVIDTFTAPVAAPHYICFEPGGQHYYIVSLELPGRISKYSVFNNVFEGALTLPGMFPSAIAITNDNTFGYVSDFNTGVAGQPNFVMKINIVTMSIVDSIPDGFTSHDLKITSDGKWVIVSNRDDERVTMIDTQTDQNFVVHIDPDSIYTINDPLKYGPFGVAIDHKDSLAFIACIKADQIRVLDIAKKAIVDSIQLPHEHSDFGPHGPTLMAVSPDNDFVYVSTQWSTRILVAQVSTGELVNTFRFDVLRPFGVTISDDGNRIYTACANFANELGRIYAIDGVNRRVVDSVDVGLNSLGLIWRAP